jgi:hypothetical protein
MNERYYVLVRDAERLPRVVARNRGGNVTTTRPLPWRAISAHDLPTDAVSALMDATHADAAREASVAARSALPAETAARYEREIAR